MMPWKYAADGKTASRLLDNGGIESRLISAIPTSELTAALPADSPILSDVKAEALIAIDEQAELTRTKYISGISGQDATYQYKANDAVTYRSAGYPVANISNYLWIQAEAKAIYGASPTAAQYQLSADGILTTQAQWVILGSSIEQQRRAGKIAVNNASTVAVVIAARDAAVAALKAL